MKPTIIKYTKIKGVEYVEKSTIEGLVGELMEAKKENDVLKSDAKELIEMLTCYQEANFEDSWNSALHVSVGHDLREIKSRLFPSPMVDSALSAITRKYIPEPNFVPDWVKPPKVKTRPDPLPNSGPGIVE